MHTSVSHVWIRGARGVTLVSLGEFLKLDRQLRALLVVEGEVEFLDADGGAVPLADALRDLRESWAPPSPATAA